jgi:2-polyprenyl-3-methyl-5-hydroxy-6-metoxy-1,4-benzoquinol methylase
MALDDASSESIPSAAPARARETSSYEPVESCILCGARQRSICFREGRFEVVRCSGCSLVYVTPRLKVEYLTDVYDKDYWKSSSPKDRGYADYVGAQSLYLRTYRKRFRLVRRFAPEPGRALDIGCAAGFFLKVLSDHGWQVAGVELSPEIARHAREAYGFDAIHTGVLETASFDPASFDLITCWDVVEHVPDPVGLLCKASSLLKPGGHVIIETQNVESWFANLLGPRWQHYKHLEHLYHFSPATIRLLLQKADLELCHQTARFGGKHVSVEFILERAVRLHPVMRFLLRPLSPFRNLHAYVNPLDEIVVVARKPLGSPDRQISRGERWWS